MLDKKAFDVNFDAAIETLTNSEKTTKQILRELSRSVLEVLFFTEDIGYVNRTINSLSPINKKLTIEYFKIFSGFHFVAEASSFGKKDKKKFEQVKAESLEFLSDPHNNIWSWADQQNFELVKKPFDINVVAKYFNNAIKKAEKAGYSDVDVLAQVFASGIDISAITQAMKQLTVKETEVMVLDAEVVESEDDAEY